MKRDRLLELLSSDVDVINKISAIAKASIQPETTLNNEVKLLNDEISSCKQEAEKEREKSMGIIKNLKAIICGNDNKIEELGNSLDNSKDTLASTQSDLKNQLKETEKTSQENIGLSNKNKDLQKELDRYEDSFKDDLNILNYYSNLSESTRDSLKGIFKSNSVTGLIACGVQEKNINLFWDYIKTQVVKGINPDLDGLIAIFKLLFSRFILAYPMYELQKDLEGVKYNALWHTKHHASTNVSGDITKVLFYGYDNKKTKKTIKPSIVQMSN